MRREMYRLFRRGKTVIQDAWKIKNYFLIFTRIAINNI